MFVSMAPFTGLNIPMAGLLLFLCMKTKTFLKELMPKTIREALDMELDEFLNLYKSEQKGWNIFGSRLIPIYNLHLIIADL